MSSRLTVLGLLFLACISCVSSDKIRTNAAGVEVTYPDEGVRSPEFCNPTGKKGQDLKQCYEFNESFYKSFDDEARQREPWFNFPSDSWAESDEVDQKYVYTVTKEQEAVSRLEQDPVVELTPAEVEQLSGIKTEIPGHKPYLLRALYYFRETGSFAVYVQGDAVMVRHDSVGSTTPKETRSAVIVYRPVKPIVLFVDCQVTE
jgi:hypothetical protein